MSAYLCPALPLPPGCNTFTASTVGTSGERSVLNSWIMGNVQLNQVRQIAYQWVAGGGAAAAGKRVTYGTVTVEPSTDMVEVVAE